MSTINKEEPNFKPSGKLVQELNSVNGIILKYNGDINSHLPLETWRIYIFKDEKLIETLFLKKRDFFIFGREKLAVQIPIDHLSCSKQHAAIQFKKTFHKTENGNLQMTVKPYLIDLESSNGTFLDNFKLDPSRFYELKSNDVIKFGSSSREYVLIQEPE